MAIIYTNPHFDVKDMKPIEKIVRDNDLFVLSPSNVEGAYGLMFYIYATQKLGIELRALVDNNILTRVISLASGDPVPEEESQAKGYLISSAVIAYLKIGNFEIEPGISIYEKGFSSNHSQAKGELHLFRVADNIRVKEWTDVALGRKKEISRNAINDSETIVSNANCEKTQKNYSHAITPWKYNYYFLLKAAEIWKSSNNNVIKACNFIHWTEKESFLSDVPSIFIMVFFSPNRYSKMIKGINSLSGRKVSHGLKNAAWDLTYIKMWARHYQSSDPSRLWLLCSNDIALRSIAKILFNDSEQSNKPVLKLLQKYWNTSDAQRIFDVYNQVYANITNDVGKRQQKIKNRIESIDNSIVDLEAKVFGT